MRIFLELEVPQNDAELERGIPLELLRLRLTDEAEVRAKAKELKSYFPDAVAYLHICRHDEDPPGSCERRRL